MSSGTGARRRVPSPGGHGGDAMLVANALGLDPDVMIDLSASMNPFAPDVARLVVDELTRGAGALLRYPDPTAATHALASAFRVDPDLLVLTNGGAEAIAQLAARLRVGNVVEPEFALYRRHLDAIDVSAPRWRSNPSNPVGQLAGEHDIAGVWDEAFYPLATGAWTRGDHESWRLGSLTKLWNCPGLRLGYLIAPTTADAIAIRHRQPQWSVNGLALALVPEMLTRTDLPGWSSRIRDLRQEFASSLTALGYRVRPTCVNWVLVEQPGLRDLLAPLGIVVRDCSSFGLPGLHRVALPRPAQLDRVLDAFQAVVTE